MVSWEELMEYLNELPLQDRLVYFKELLKNVKDEGIIGKIKKEISVIEKELSKDKSWQAGGEVGVSRGVIVDEEEPPKVEVKEENLEEIAEKAPVVQKVEVKDNGLDSYMGGGTYTDFEGGYRKIDASITEEQVHGEVEKNVMHQYSPKIQSEQQMKHVHESTDFALSDRSKMSESERIIKDTEKYKKGGKV